MSLNPMHRKELISSRLQSLNPTELEVIDESQMHAGHAGAQGGGSHFMIKIVSTQFAGLSLIKRHQLVYQALDGLIPQEIHAIKINARTPEEG